MCPAFNRTALPLGIVWVPDAVTATAVTAAAAVVTRDHATPREAVPAADIVGVAPE